MWLQSLNLTYKVKNTKRDLANGFVIAEILSRYYSTDDKEQQLTKISMHSFDTGFSMQAKKTNWALLSKIMKKYQVPVTDKDIDNVLHCAPDAALQALIKVYDFLTGKTAEAPNQAEPEVPDYAKPTIFQKLKDKQVIRIVNKNALISKAEEIITKHNEDVQNLRITRQDRFTKTKHVVIREDSSKMICEAKQKKMEEKQKKESEDEDNANETHAKAGGKNRANAKQSRRAALTLAEEETVIITFDAILNDIINTILSAKMEHEEKEELRELLKTMKIKEGNI